MPKVVLISGKAQSGKDTFARLFKEYAEPYEELENKRVLILKYGDILKFICKQFFNWNGEKDLEGRTLLQRVGTDIFRENNPDTWVNCVIEIVKGLGNLYDYILIPDTRFPNEISKWMGCGIDYVTVRIDRVNADNTPFDNKLSLEQKSHISETALDRYVFDYHVTNRKLIDLSREVVGIYNELEGF